MKIKLIFVIPMYVLMLSLFTNISYSEIYEGIDIPEGAVSFADAVVEFNIGPMSGVDPIEGDFTDPTQALGIPDEADDTFHIAPALVVSLGNGGDLTLQFTDNALTTSGDATEDLWIFEDREVEPSYIEISKDGVTFIPVGMVAGSTSGVDIDAYIGAGVVLWEKYYYVKIIDADARLTPEPYAGADIDAVAAISSEPLPPANILPTANAGADQTVATGASVDLNGASSTDQDGFIATYSWQQIQGTIVALVGADTATPTFTAPGAPETLEFQLTVTDNDGGTDTDTCLVNAVEPPNRAPTASISPTVQKVAENVTVTLNGANSFDIDGSIISYSWKQVSGPIAVALSGATSMIATFTAPAVDVSGEAFIFELTVTDNDTIQDTANCIINVSNTNNFPIAVAGPVQTVAGGALVALNGLASFDPDAGDDIQSYTWTQIAGPPWVTLSDPSSATTTFTAPMPANDVSLEFLLTVTDNGGLMGSNTCIVNIAVGTNQPPVAAAGIDIAFTEGDMPTVALDGSTSSDPEAALASYEWRQLTGPPVTLTDPQGSSCSFSAPNVPAGDSEALLLFELVVTDDQGLKDSDTVLVTIYQKPTITPNGGGGGGGCFIKSLIPN